MYKNKNLLFWESRSFFILYFSLKFHNIMASSAKFSHIQFASGSPTWRKCGCLHHKCKHFVPKSLSNKKLLEKIDSKRCRSCVQNLDDSVLVEAYGHKHEWGRIHISVGTVFKVCHKFECINDVKNIAYVGGYEPFFKYYKLEGGDIEKWTAFTKKELLAECK